MPKIYEYLNIAFFFYSNEHEPIHIHARKGSNETIFVIIINDSEISNIKTRKVRGRDHLKNNDFVEAEKLVTKFGADIVRKWIDFFIYKKIVRLEKINTRL